MNLLIINGPNLNLLGKREAGIYGEQSFESYLSSLKKTYKEIQIQYFQSNIEGELIDQIQGGDSKFDGIILNAGGYTHTSVSIADAIAAISTPVIEVHISNIFGREDFRNKSIISPYTKGNISGFGLKVYQLAIEAFLHP